MSKIMVIGAVGQIGSELTVALRKKHGGDNVIATTRKTAFPEEIANGGPCEYFDVQDRAAMEAAVKKASLERGHDRIFVGDAGRGLPVAVHAVDRSSQAALRRLDVRLFRVQ